MKKFQQGDQVRLVKPFRCQGDDEDTDEKIDAKLRQAYGDETPVAVVDNYVEDGWMAVTFDRPVPGHGSTLYVDEDVLELLHPPATEEEVAEAIRSILGG